MFEVLVFDLKCEDMYLVGIFVGVSGSVPGSVRNGREGYWKMEASHHPAPTWLDPCHSRSGEVGRCREVLVGDCWDGDGRRVGLVDGDGGFIVQGADLAQRSRGLDIGHVGQGTGGAATSILLGSRSF